MNALAIATKAGEKETGGVVIGFYDAGLLEATVTELSAPPEDSQATRFTFLRGVRGLLSRLKELWGSPARRYYLGEWHFHPFEGPVASSDDHDQMRAIARSDRYKCPEPILIILGGDPRSTWKLSVSIYLSDGDRILLAEA